MDAMTVLQACLSCLSTKALMRHLREEVTALETKPEAALAQSCAMLVDAIMPKIEKEECADTRVEFSKLMERLNSATKALALAQEE